jgi:hypothetical protein
LHFKLNDELTIKNNNMGLFDKLKKLKDDRYIAGERKKIQAATADIDDLLEDFKVLVKNAVDYELNYSISSLKYVELVLIQLKPDWDDDRDLIEDAAFYLGETMKRTYNGQWDISEAKEPAEFYAQPIISGYKENKMFYPVLEIKNFLKNPSTKYFEKI